MKFLLFSLALLGVTVYSVEANPEMAAATVSATSYEIDDMGGDGKKGKKMGSHKKGKKMGSHKKGPMSMGGFRMGGDDEDDDMDGHKGKKGKDGHKGKKGKKGKKTPQTSNFRVSGEEEVSCPEMKYMIVNAQNNRCLDSSNKRLASKACDESAHQMFTMSAVGEKMMVVGGDDMCISADSATKGPCAEGLTVTRTGATYRIKFNNNKCLNSKNKNQVNLMKCNPKRKLQNWRLVPTFTYKMAQPESSGFRIDESGGDKKHKKGDKKSMGVGGAGQKGNKKAMGGFRITGFDEVDDMNDRKGKKEKKMGSHKKGPMSMGKFDKMASMDGDYDN
jgi:hypothetical protein